MESITSRDMHDADLPGVTLLIERANAQRDRLPLPVTPTDLRTVEKIKDKVNRPGAWADIASVGQSLAGVCLGYPVSQARDLPVEYTGGEYISLLMVEPAYWGRGIASKLLDQAADRTRQMNKQQLLLLTREAHNDHARGVYEHKGFTLTGDTRPSEYGLQVLYLMNL